eukprot:13558467-Alexandrium_andersonii.AAC.1
MSIFLRRFSVEPRVRQPIGALRGVWASSSAGLAVARTAGCDSAARTVIPPPISFCCPAQVEFCVWRWVCWRPCGFRCPAQAKVRFQAFVRFSVCFAGQSEVLAFRTVTDHLLNPECLKSRKRLRDSGL